ncbi:TIGR03826 family flagellar region protein [Amphibacillus sediminis]|uniref:TIGR03826 family flagellar region protein n=1 Tax=Amphibacillus sediminis TaxID=360185 RepID=UPI00082F7955|nr:TIGR03826 family flagellar region protein [Amphibacillus sediminis]
MAELDNCLNCDKLFVKTTRSICPECYKEEEQQYQIVYEFLKKRSNRQATIPEIVKATGVEEQLIIKFVKEKRLRTTQFPNLAYPCEKCGTMIDEGKLCSSCSSEISQDLAKEIELEAIADKRAKEKTEKVRTYFAVDKVKKKN